MSVPAMGAVFCGIFILPKNGRNGVIKMTYVKKLALAAMFVALGIVLPLAFHLIPGGLGRALLPMHIPVLLCGFICGWRYGLAAGVLVPILSSLFTTVPPMFPTALSMALELGAYGAVTGLMSKKFNVFISLICAMLVGRVVMAVANLVFLGMQDKAYTFEAFLSGAFTTALPGIIIQLVLIPAIIISLQKARLIK